MPEIISHYVMGKKTLMRLDEEIRSIIDEDIFYFAANGPDPYYFYRFLFPKGKQKGRSRSSIMHETRTGEFLIQFILKCRDKQSFSFLAGFLCHYALDSTAHPFIRKLADDKKYMHMAIEHKIDMILLERAGKSRRNMMDFFVPYAGIPVFENALEEVYGWRDHMFRSGYHYMKIWYYLIKDSHGMLEKAFRLMKSDKERIPYSSHVCDAYDFTQYDELEARSIEDAVAFIQSAYSFMIGAMTTEQLREIIGNRSYSGKEKEDLAV